MSSSARKLGRTHDSSRAHGFALIREHHKKEIIEDYLEAIFDLSKESGEVRVSELSRHFGVSMATVNQHVKRIEGLKYITAKPYRSIFLTEKGKEIALHSLKRHNLVIDFLLTIGVPLETAHFEAEGLEHHLGDNTLLCLERLIKRMKKLQHTQHC